MTRPCGLVIVRVSRSTVISLPARLSTSATSACSSSSGMRSAARPIFVQLLLKMSANDGAMTTSKPKSCRPHGACSREEPQPKLRPASRIFAPVKAGLLSGKSSRRVVPSSSNFQS